VVQSESTKWAKTLDMNQRKLTFKIDTGADVTVIPESYYRKKRDEPSQEKLTVIMGTVSPLAHCPSQQDHNKIVGYCMYQKRDRASCKWTWHNRLYTGGLTDSVLFPNYSHLINHLPGSPSRFI